MEVLLLRHGQSVADIEDRHEGRADFPLTALGRRQAHLASEWVASRYPPALLLASPLQRAAETARILAANLDLPVTFDDDLVEIGNGVYAGLTFAEAEQLYPWPQGGFKPHEAPLQGETRIAFRCRIETFWSRFQHTVEDQGQRVAIVTHGGVIQMLYHCFLGLPVTTDLRVVTGDTGMHLWRMTGDTRIVLFANRLDHLASLS